MKDSFLTRELRQNRDHPVHLFLQIFILAQLYRNVTVNQTDGITAVKLDVIGYHFIFLENSGQRNCCIQYRVSFDIQLLIHNNTVYLNPVKIRYRLIPGFGALHKNTISVKKNITVQIMNTPHRLFLFYTDTDCIPVDLGHLECIYKSNIICICCAVYHRCKHRVRGQRSPQHHLFYFFI